ncbi:MAG: hypothetical protein PQJ58_00710 [Spirochaetales bacterium]|nr:hypothetical protein [Spirochaetales bacterium]
MSRYIVNKNYDDAPDDPVRVLCGETLELVETSDPQGDWPHWVYCKTESKEGWIPEQILEIDKKKIMVLEDYVLKSIH